MAKTLNTVSNTSHAAQSVMARILATENIKVVIDQKMQTAAFDLKNRTLLLPQWKDMGKVVYDMLIGHEISHALHTPAEGWRSTCEKIGGTTDTSSKAYQTASLYLNVVEDARIERLIQIKFPGFRRDFIGAYTELHNKNFFGVKGVDLNTLTLADRINLYYKLGTIGSVGINFTAAEDQFIRRIDSATTFADAAQIAEDLFRYCNEQQHKNQQQQQNGNGSPNKPCNNGKDDKSQGDQSKQGEPRGDSDTSETKDGSRGDQGGDEKRDGAGDDAQDGGDQADQQGKQPADSSNNDEQQQQSGPVGSQHSQSDVPPTPMTQKNLNDNLQQQVQRDQYAKDVIAPTQLVHCNLDNVIIDCKKIVEAKRKDFEWMTNPAACQNGSHINHAAIVTKTTKEQADFMHASKKQIDLLMKQFELRKAAQIAKRESIRKTGILDTVRMVNYKHSEDIFRRNTMLPEGKNHGLVMFVDWSGSMQQCLAAVIEQTMVLVEFCRRMSIPYEVYAFTTRSFESGIDSGGWNPAPGADIAVTREKMWKGTVNDNYTKNTPEEVMAQGYESPRSHTQFSLLNLLSSRLNRTEHQEMMVFLRALVSRHYEVTSTFHANARWELSGTALDESIVAAMQIVPQFKEANKLDIVNTIFLTDGETSVPYMTGSQLIDPKSKAIYSADQFFSDEERNAGYVDYYGQSTNILLLALRDITKSNVVGMFLTSRADGINVLRNFRKEVRRQSNMLMAGKSVKDKYAQMSCEREARKIVAASIGKQFNDDNCVVAESGTTGYSEYFIIKSTTRVLGDEKDVMDQVQQGATQAAIKKAFLKSFDNKNKSRVLINRFIELIAR